MALTDLKLRPLSLGTGIIGHGYLIRQMIRRDVAGRYRGSLIGVAWSFLNPLFMLAVYTFVFGSVFKAKWGVAQASTSGFALVLFSGMIVHGLLAECLTRAPALILDNVNYVKKIVFPLEILPWVMVGSALFHTLVSLLILVAANLLIFGRFSWTVALLPVVLLPYLLFLMGLVWFLSGLGAYLRDIRQVTGVLATVFMFLGPVFYPITALPPAVQPWVWLNPLTAIIEGVRAVALYGQTPDWVTLSAYTLVAVVVFLLGFIWFQKTRRGFGDVL